MKLKCFHHFNFVKTKFRSGVPQGSTLGALFFQSKKQVNCKLLNSPGWWLVDVYVSVLVVCVWVICLCLLFFFFCYCCILLTIFLHLLLAVCIAIHCKPYKVYLNMLHHVSLPHTCVSVLLTLCWYSKSQLRHWFLPVTFVSFLFHDLCLLIIMVATQPSSSHIHLTVKRVYEESGSVILLI